MSVLAPPRGLTTAELACRLGRRADDVERILEDCRVRGIVDPDEHGGWRLSAATELRYGRWLRELGTWVDIETTT